VCGDVAAYISGALVCVRCTVQK